MVLISVLPTSVTPYLSGAILNGANLSYATLSRADLNGARAYDADLHLADLGNANLKDAQFNGANFIKANLRQANLSRADLSGANLNRTDLSYANLSEASLSSAVLVQTDLTGAILTQCHVYGIAAWNVTLEGATQKDLVITQTEEPTITADNLKIAQFMYLLLNNTEIRQVIDTITSKVVLILGRFTPERKAILDAIREELRRRDFIPVLFDFDKPDSKDVTGTVETLARMARFIIADLTDPSSIPHELATIVPFLRTTPVLPLKRAGAGGYGMFSDLQRAYPWVLKTHEYIESKSLVSALPTIIAPVDKLVHELRSRS